MKTKPNWKAFYTVLGLLGCKALKSVPRGLVGVVDETAAGTDDFWSRMLEETFFHEWEQVQSEQPTNTVTLRDYKKLLRGRDAAEELAIQVTLRDYAENVREQLRDYEEEYKIDKISETWDAKVIQLLVKAAKLDPTKETEGSAQSNANQPGVQLDRSLNPITTGKADVGAGGGAVEAAG